MQEKGHSVTDLSVIFTISIIGQVNSVKMKLNGKNKSIQLGFIWFSFYTD